MNCKKYRTITAAVALSVLATLAAHAQQKLSLDEAVSLAKAQNPELQATALDVSRAEQQRIIARSALLPTVTASGVLNHYFDLPPFFGPRSA